MALSIQAFCIKYGIGTVLPHRREITYRRYLKDNNHSDAYCQWLATKGYKTKNSHARKAEYAFHCLLQPSKVTSSSKAGKTARIPIKGWKNKEIAECHDLAQLHKEMGHNASMSDKFFNGYFSAMLTFPRATRSGRLYS